MKVVGVKLVRWLTRCFNRTSFADARAQDDRAEMRDAIRTEIKVRQRGELRQQSCKLLYIFYNFTLWQLEYGDATQGGHRRELPPNELQLCPSRAIVTGVVPEAPAQTDHGRQAHLVQFLFDSLRGPPQHDRPASRQSLAPVF